MTRILKTMNFTNCMSDNWGNFLGYSKSLSIMH